MIMKVEKEEKDEAHTNFSKRLVTQSTVLHER